MTPVLFLDIDGVLNTPDSCLQNRSNEVFLPSAVKNLLLIVEKTNCHIVITSSWRTDHKQQRILPAFQENGLASLESRVIGFTPDLSSKPGTTREDEIQAWLDANRPGAPCAILDDDPSQFPGALCSRLVLVDDRSGLTSKNAEHCIRLLQQSP